jgi:hypothetical protein
MPLIYHALEQHVFVKNEIYIIRMIKSRWMRWAGHVARMWEIGNTYEILVGKSEGKSPLRSPRCRWEYNIKKWIVWK